jgi:hypothetical protein
VPAKHLVTQIALLLISVSMSAEDHGLAELRCPNEVKRGERLNCEVSISPRPHEGDVALFFAGPDDKPSRGAPVCTAKEAAAPAIVVSVRIGADASNLKLELTPPDPDPPYDRVPCSCKIYYALLKSALSVDDLQVKPDVRFRVLNKK